VQWWRAKRPIDAARSMNQPPVLSATTLRAAAGHGTRRRFAGACLAACAALPQAASAQVDSLLVPSSAYAQAGVSKRTHTLVFGANWDWSWQHEFAGGDLTGYWEASFGRWSCRLEPGRSIDWVTQLGVTPVLRWRPKGAGNGWFVEAGIGVNLLLPTYRSGDKQFSTTFNFGDHVAVGRRFGDAGRHEVALRLQHFSNAGIKQPNPGENFVQLRYSRRF
jgi:lipid A 3-O-deacylase